MEWENLSSRASKIVKMLNKTFPFPNTISGKQRAALLCIGMLWESASLTDTASGFVSLTYCIDFKRTSGISGIALNISSARANCHLWTLNLIDNEEDVSVPCVEVRFRHCYRYLFRPLLGDVGRGNISLFHMCSPLCICPITSSSLFSWSISLITDQNIITMSFEYTETRVINNYVNFKFHLSINKFKFKLELE